MQISRINEEIEGCGFFHSILDKKTVGKYMQRLCLYKFLVAEYWFQEKKPAIFHDFDHLIQNL